MPKTFLSMLAVALLLVPAAQSFAQAEATSADMKPLVTVSFSGYDKLLANIGVIGRLGGDSQLADRAEMFLKAMTQDKGLAGLDTKRPWAVVALSNGDKQPALFGFIPVTDLKQLIEAAKSYPPLAEAITLNDDVYQIQGGAQTIYLKQKGTWAVITNESENLAVAPADPMKLLGDLPNRYDLALLLSVANLPVQYREQFLAYLRAGVEAGMAQMPNESEAEYTGRVFGTKQSLEQLAAAVNEAENLLAGWAVTPNDNSTHLDIELTAKSGTKLADRLEQIKPGHSQFAGFLLPDAAVRAVTIATLTDADVAQAKTTLNALRKSAIEKLQSDPPTKFDAKVATELLGEVIDILEKTVETKKKDSALAVVLGPGIITAVAGSSVAEGGKLDGLLKRFVDELGKSDPEVAKFIKLDTESHDGVHFHTATIPNPSMRLVQFMGEQLEAIVGIAEDKVVAATGRDAAKTLKNALDQSKAAVDKEVLPLEITITATPIAKFLASAAQREPVKATATAMATVLEKSGGKDHVLVTARPITQGIRVRLQIEEGVLKALGLFRQMSSAGAVTPGNANQPGAGN